MLRNARAKGHINLLEFYKDINWFISFLEEFNGSVNFYSQPKNVHNVFVDVSLDSVGGKFMNSGHTCEIPQH